MIETFNEIFEAMSSEQSADVQAADSVLDKMNDTSDQIDPIKDADLDSYNQIQNNIEKSTLDKFNDFVFEESQADEELMDKTPDKTDSVLDKLNDVFSKEDNPTPEKNSGELNNPQKQELSEDQKAELKNKLNWTDKQISKCTIDENGTIHYKTDCEYMEGKETENGVPYERKSVVISDKTIEGVFPVFDSKFDVQLPQEMEKSSNTKQFNECNSQLNEAIQNDPDLKSEFTDEQIDDIESGYVPTGYVWHHNEEPGKMQLVRIEDHDKTQGGAAHTGGKALWGGSYGNTSTNNI